MLFALTAPPTPPALLHPSGVWFFNWVIPILGGLVVLLAVIDTIRRRRLTWGYLFLTNSMLVYWMETVGDWGQQLIYSPTFAQHHLLDWLPLKTPNDPLFMPFAYACYWTVHAWLVLKLGQFLVRRYGWSLLKAIAVLAIPVNYAWDFLVEATAAAMGWWVYDPGIGPHMDFANGGKFTLLWTIGIMSFWPNLIAYWAGKPPIRTLNHFERFLGLRRFTQPKRPIPDAVHPDQHGVNVPAGGATLVADRRTTARVDRTAEFDAFLDYQVTISRWKFELARFGSWFVIFQISFFAMTVLPLLVMRVATGSHSIYVP
ncbi:MAG: hypothetical protein QOJ80_2338 [Mycobacterium sp.]|jgi:hypothetical protein|nr:hypothetical protein [Mycobacterium sp.]